MFDFQICLIFLFTMILGEARSKTDAMFKYMSKRMSLRLILMDPNTKKIWRKKFLFEPKA